MSLARMMGISLGRVALFNKATRTAISSAPRQTSTVRLSSPPPAVMSDMYLDIGRRPHSKYLQMTWKNYSRTRVLISMLSGERALSTRQKRKTLREMGQLIAKRPRVRYSRRKGVSAEFANGARIYSSPENPEVVTLSWRVMFPNSPQGEAHSYSDEIITRGKPGLLVTTRAQQNASDLATTPDEIGCYVLYAGENGTSIEIPTTYRAVAASLHDQFVDRMLRDGETTALQWLREASAMLA